jgi:GAF domain-containing protein
VRFGQLPVVEKQIVSEKNYKPAFDEQTLAKILEAAYVLQEHNREVREQQEREASRGESTKLEAAKAKAQVPNCDTRETAVLHSSAPASGEVKAVTKASPAPSSENFTVVLSQIVDTQHQIQSEHLDLEPAMALIAERAREITHAAGAGIGMLDGLNVRYRAAAGSLTLLTGSEVPMEKALGSASLRIGQVIRCSNVNLEFLVDAQECEDRGIEALIAAPIYHAGAVAGTLELYYGKSQTFNESDVHTCQFMAGLVGEVLSRNEEFRSKKSLAAERAAMRDALEKLKPNLEALIEKPSVKTPVMTAATAPELATEAPVCKKCGNHLVGEEQFCGKCGSPRTSDDPVLSMQSKVAMLWQMQERQKGDDPAPSNGSSNAQASAVAFDPFTAQNFSIASSESELPELFSFPEPETESPAQLEEPSPALDLVPAANSLALEAKPPEPAAKASESPEPIAVEAAPRVNWNSAAAARDFLERLARDNRHSAFLRFLKARRGDIYLAIAVILVACVIRWGIWSSPTVGSNPAATAATHHRPQVELSLFDRMLIKLGLAEAPDPPEYKGNPDAQVWIDLKTALYYCPGTDLYGKTPKGRFSSQHDAQLDQYEPAFRRVCD